MKRISIFGASGSIGQNTLDLIRREHENFKVVEMYFAQNEISLKTNGNDLIKENIHSLKI